MTDDLFTSFGQSASTDPGRLVDLGKTAAALAETSDLTLHDACVETLSGTSLNEEQVRRVVENANTEAFNKKFAAMDPSCRVVDLTGGPADPMEVVAALQSKADAGVKSAHVWDYHMPPEAWASRPAKVASIHVDGMTLRETFIELEGLRSKLASAHEDLTAKHASAELRLRETLDELREKVKLASAELCFEDLAQAWMLINPELAKVAMARMPELRSRGGMKVAHRLNPAHPVVTLYADFVKRAEEMQTFSVARQEVERELVRLDEYFDSPHIKEASASHGDVLEYLGKGIGTLARGGVSGTKAVFRGTGSVGAAAGREMGVNPEITRRVAQVGLGTGGTALAADTPQGRRFRMRHGILRPKDFGMRKGDIPGR